MFQFPALAPEMIRWRCLLYTSMLAVNDDVRPEQVVFLPQDDIQSVVQISTITIGIIIHVSYTHLDVYKRQPLIRGFPNGTTRRVEDTPPDHFRS